MREGAFWGPLARHFARRTRMPVARAQGPGGADSARTGPLRPARHAAPYQHSRLPKSSGWAAVITAFCPNLLPFFVT